jgi:hypothetical protein
MEFILIGYAPKKTQRHVEWLPQVDEIASASDCISGGPGWDVTNWSHNNYWLYSTRALATDILPDSAWEESHSYEMYAFKLFPIVVDQGQIQDAPVQVEEVEPLDETSEFLGYDAVSRSQGNSFECSPLSCNSAANEMKTNRYCLFSTLEEALAGAQKFSSQPYEPGPYYVVEVYRNPFALKER